jgi:hypothetical protein
LLSPFTDTNHHYYALLLSHIIYIDKNNKL